MFCIFVCIIPKVPPRSVQGSPETPPRAPKDPSVHPEDPRELPRRAPRARNDPAGVPKVLQGPPIPSQYIYIYNNWSRSCSLLRGEREPVLYDCMRKIRKSEIQIFCVHNSQGSSKVRPRLARDSPKSPQGSLSAPRGPPGASQESPKSSQ